MEPGPGTPARTAAKRLQLLAHHGHRGQASRQGQTLFVGETRRKRTLYRIKTFIQNKRSPEEGRGLVRAGRQRVQKGLKATAIDLLQIKTAQDCAHWPRNVVSAPKTKVSVQAAGAGSPCDQSLRAEGTDPFRPPQPPRPRPGAAVPPGGPPGVPGSLGRHLVLQLDESSEALVPPLPPGGQVLGVVWDLGAHGLDTEQRGRG